MKIAIIGAGYVGLVTAACLSEFGFDVTCVERDGAKIDQLLAGIVPFYEPGLGKLVSGNINAGRLSFTRNIKDAVPDASVVFIAVGTPTRRDSISADLTFVYDAAREIAGAMQGFTVITTKSTVPVGTASEIRKVVSQAAPDKEFEVASNPEFLREGSAIEDFMEADRIVVGTSGERSRELMGQIYQPLAQRGVEIVHTSCEDAELIKYAANAYLAMRIAYINEIADLCEATGGDVQMVARGMGLDSRIGPKYLQPGPGFGGSCFPKDTRALLSIARDYGSAMTIIEAVIQSNDKRKETLVDRVVRAAGGDVSGKRVAILGVAFKEDTDDMRDSPALDLIPALQKQGMDVCAYDPVAMENAARLLPGVTWADSPASCVI
ncbi:MAG: UDP-glucose/GDP-mannose dehydrogenase family protein, partial [Anderseniella sp.]